MGGIALGLPGIDAPDLPCHGDRGLIAWCWKTKHQERKAALFLSLLMYGAALMALPRFKRAISPA